MDRNLGEFFQDFERFVHVTNYVFAEYGKYGNFPFRLKDLPETQDLDLRGIRRFQIYYNHTYLGELDVSPSFYDRENYHVDIRLLISRPRWLEYETLASLINHISSTVTGPSLSEIEAELAGRSQKASEKMRDNRHILDIVMLKTLWTHYAYSYHYFKADYFGELEVRFSGSAYGYIEERDKLGSSPEARGKKPDPRFNDRGPFRRDN